MCHVSGLVFISFIFCNLLKYFPQDAFQRSHGQVKVILKEVNSEFKTYKANLEYLERAVRRQKRMVENLIKNGEPAMVQNSLILTHSLSYQFESERVSERANKCAQEPAL